ncbi:MAG: hypothetical protein WBM12_00230, partial [Pseudolabrys sp.]
GDADGLVVDRQHHGMGQIATALTVGGFAMAADRSQSPAYQALTPAARKVLAVTEGRSRTAAVLPRSA